MRRCSRPGSGSCRRSVSAWRQSSVSRFHAYRPARRGKLIGARSEFACGPRAWWLSRGLIVRPRKRHRFKTDLGGGSGAARPSTRPTPRISTTSARHFTELLVDAHIATSWLSWQWMAATGTNSRPTNPVIQGKHDPQGRYVRRWVPEPRGPAGVAVHEPWKLPVRDRARYDHLAPLVDLSDTRDCSLRARGRA
ncbi:FAD-binding domain-containing protein [Streptomyces sp. NPDC055094]